MSGVDDKFIILLEKISDISERTARMEAVQETMKESIEQIKKEDALQNQLLAEHIQGTVTNRERLEVEIKNRQGLEQRVVKLEEPQKFFSVLKKIAVYIAAIAGAILSIKKLFHF